MSDPPYYVLVSHTSALNTQAPSSSSLSHPIIEYHYADDSPYALLPRPGEHVLVLDYDPAKGPTSPVKSLSADLAVTGVRVTDAPGVGLEEEQLGRNNRMYILETVVMPEDTLEEDDYQMPQAILARFKQRNAALRRVLDYPETLSVQSPPVAAENQSPPIS